MASRTAFFKRLALDESVHLTTLGFYGWVYAGITIGVAIGVLAKVLS